MTGRTDGLSAELGWLRFQLRQQLKARCEARFARLGLKTERVSTDESEAVGRIIPKSPAEPAAAEPRARDTLEGSFWMARWLARKRYAAYHRMPREDYEQEAFLALVIAWNRFRPTRKVKFTTYAFRVVRGAIINAELRWIAFHRGSDTMPDFTFEDEELDGVEAQPCMTESEASSADALFYGEWFARMAKLRLLYGLSVTETCRLCNVRPTAVWQATTYFKRRLYELSA